MASSRYAVIPDVRPLGTAPTNQGIAVGFSGTRKGMTPVQERAVRQILDEMKPRPLLLHHGCCVGADAQANAIARELEIMTVGHPPTSRAAIAADLELDFRLPPRPYLVRNLEIIRRCETIIAVPRSMTPARRGSGTWHVIRHTRHARKPLVIVFPDGEIRRN